MSDLPIGYWLKHLDRLIENDFDRALASEALGRRDWQVLHALREGATTPAELDERLAPFLEEGEPTTEPVVEGLRARGWVEGPVPLSVTGEGVRAHDALLERVEASRRRLTEGIGDREYRAAVDVLERMSANLEGR